MKQAIFQSSAFDANEIRQLEFLLKLTSGNPAIEIGNTLLPFSDWHRPYGIAHG